MQFPTFHTLLTALLDGDNVRRGAAEAEYSRLKSDADNLLGNLVQVRCGDAPGARCPPCGTIVPAFAVWLAPGAVHPR